MRKLFMPFMLAGSLALGGCAYGLGGQDVLGSVLGSVLGGGHQGQGGPDFQTMAVDACAAEAARYGRVGVRQVQQAGSNTLRVFGDVNDGYRQRAFACDYRSDGRITNFTIQ